MSRVVILMGSPRDGDWSEKVAAPLEGWGITVVRRVGSAHRVPEHVLSILRELDADDEPTVLVTVAGMSDALSGLSDASVSLPVIACPPRSEAFAGLDVLSSLRTPPGVAPIVALEPANAALAAAKILALAEPSLRDVVRKHQQAAAQRVLDADAEVSR
jgi:5-(carboxyamino)imidazole ribonucleotide mutase